MFGRKTDVNFDKAGIQQPGFIAGAKIGPRLPFWKCRSKRRIQVRTGQIGRSKSLGLAATAPARHGRN